MRGPGVAIASIFMMCLGLGLASAQEEAIREGDRVTVVVPSAEVRSGDTLVGQVKRDEVYFVRGVNGDWLEVLVGGKAGYVPRSAVRLATGEAARGVGEPPRMQAAEPEKGRRYALLVGVREYDATQLKSLQFSEADIEGLADVLPDLGYRADDVVLMTQSRASKSFRHVPTVGHIRRELDLLLAEAGPDDTLLVALAGHGVQFRGEPESYFCPADARLEDRSTLLPLGDVHKALEAGKAGSKIMLVDACRNDPQSAVARSREVVDLESVTRPQALIPPGGVATFFSCSAGQQSFEHPDLKHGVFFNFVIEGLKGAADLDRDEVVDLAELEQYAGKRVQSYVRTNLAQVQLPERRGEVRGGLSLGRLEGDPGPPLVSAAAYLKRGNDWYDAKAYGKAIRDMSEAIRLDPGNAAAYNGRSRARKERGDSDGAIADLGEAIRLDPENDLAYNNRGYLRAIKGDFDGAIADFDAAIRLAPTLRSAYSNRAASKSAKRDFDGAIADYGEAIRLDPENAAPYNDRGRLRVIKEDFDGAIADYGEAIRLDPKLPSAHHGRGYAQCAKRDFDGAIADFDAAIRLDPEYAVAYNDRGALRQFKGDFDGAIADYGAAIRLNPKNAAAYDTRAWIWSTAADARFRDGRRAVESATKACELTGFKIPDYLETLAAAHAEAGEFDIAVLRQEEAVALLGPAPGTEALARSRERLDLYRARRPYHETPKP